MSAFVESGRLLREGETCWKLAEAPRVAFLVDGEAFFGAVAEAVENARQSVWLVGWDFHSGVRLRRDEAEGPQQLVSLLEDRVRRQASLQVRVLAWDFAMLYAFEREFLPLLQFGAKTHRRIHFAMDSAHPATASQHQKIVVVDDALAFVGGFDLTTNRWDTRQHRPREPRRRTPAGKPYEPFHDVQIAVDGEAAAALGVLARERWRRATGEGLRPTQAEVDPWPESLEPALREVRVAIARTQPSHAGDPEVREVEALYEESIAAARRWIYIENQYLTSARIGDWLATRLSEPEGPEIVIVGPRKNAGWLEESTMGALRDRVVRRLREADVHDRLRVLYPHVEGLPPDQMLNVHSKVMLIDDDFARVGSSNLSNRSLGLDSECDLAFVSEGRGSVRRAIRRFRNDLLAEHLGTSVSRVEEELERSGSLVRCVDSLAGGGPRSLRPLELEASPEAAEAVEALGAVDPEHPVPLEELVERFVEESDSVVRPRRSLTGFVLVLVVLAVCAVAIQTTPLGDALRSDRLALALSFLRGSWYGALLGTGIFILASLLMVPVTALTAAAGLVFGPAVGVAVAWSATTASAALGHWVGQRLWRESVRRLAGDRLNALSRRLARRGVLSSAFVRVVPVAPFTVVNLVAGASHVRLRDFVLGTALGVLPGTVVLVLAADGLKLWLAGARSPAWVWAALAVLAGIGVGIAARRLRTAASPSTDEPGTPAEQG